MDEWPLTMKPTNLDILLIGMYGKKKVNSLVEEFSNNMGVVEDPSEIASLVKEMYWDQWLRSYNAITMEYNPLEPFTASKEIEQSDDRDVNKSNESSRNETISNKTSIGVESTETGNVKVDSTNNITNSGSDIVGSSVLEISSTSTNSVNSGNDTVETTTTETSDRKHKVSESGEEELSKTAEETSYETDKTNLNDKFGSVGTSHNITNNETTNTSKSDTVESKATAPYDTDHLKVTEKDTTKLTTSDTSSKTLSETTIDKNIVEKDISNNSDETNVTTFGKVVDTNDEVETTETRNNVTKYGKMETSSDSTTAETTGSHQTTFGKIENSTTSSEQSNTNTLESSTTRTNTGDSTIEKEGSETVSDSLSRNVTTKESGNKWWSTSQELITQELELRKSNFYKSMVGDVVKLLTISVY